ncbi:hypothetical protein BMW24_011490 [Mycobacterium heckeshornense]|uniref:Hemerythrin-like domain-containing protein n=1 Tax=Mycobacterium heckeshornense TaxID=110505 RepID=A0A2G8BA33_9MYCO|nr:hemerythrin domain-containing protein [Mycobacterium heckeshornense]KMV19725.1 hypothetical protein ACT16_20745 [Mycobacterium heckeshornense]MCV7035733.1 hemerythrin domain-containing protein [Mycobacterium heckeshornense]PIJ34620.1 hypothetical protein BMW24_011490 [Mycobacterium heckeshornense]BCO36950.1 hypothetical protein MHEC_33830 [Mycobacterium heckeshornense]
MSERIASRLGRRELLAIPVVAGGLASAACGGPSPKPHAPQQEPSVTPPEDLMREHGVLKRVLLIYREAIRRLEAGEPIPVKPLAAGAGIIRNFIEDYHEHLEEQYVFPRLEQAGKLTDVTAILRTQHQRGRALTDRVLAATSAPAAPDPQSRERLMRDLSAFVRMYEPHEAREDTVVFPALRDTMPAREFLELADTFEDEEHRRFGHAGFEGIVDHVADIEKSLGIYELAQFTPS